MEGALDVRTHLGGARINLYSSQTATKGKRQTAVKSLLSSLIRPRTTVTSRTPYVYPLE